MRRRKRESTLFQTYSDSTDTIISQIEITREIGQDNIFLFGTLSEHVEDLRHAHRFPSHSHPFTFPHTLNAVFSAIKSGMFGDAAGFSALIDGIVDHGDYYLVSDDFQSYVETQELIDKAYGNQEEWVDKCIISVSRMGFFTSDRCISEYAEMIWNVEPLGKPKENGA